MVFLLHHCSGVVAQFFLRLLLHCQMFMIRFVNIVFVGLSFRIFLISSYSVYSDVILLTFFITTKRKQI